MLRLFINLVIIMFVVRLLRPVFRMAGGMFKSSAREKPKTQEKKSRDVDYSDYTPYEIEDAEYEDVSKDRK